MVLHNNKWDRKAKQRYLKKHGINQAPEPPKGPQPKWTGPHDDSSSESGSESGSELGSAIGLEAGTDVNSDEKSTTAQEIEPETRTQEGESERPELLEEFELEDPYARDNDRLVAEHIASFKYTKPQPKHVVYSDNQKEFEEINESIAKGKLTQDIKRRFGKPKFKLQEEEDDDFWAATKPTTKAQAVQEPSQRKAIDIDESKQAWLDKLLD